MSQRRCGQVGIACKQSPKGLLITGFKAGSDASTSELRVGDVIVQVEENFLPGLPAPEAFELMNGRMLAPVELTVARQVKDVKKTMFRGQQTFVTEIIRDVPVPPTKASVGFDFKIEAQGLRVVTVHDKTSAFDELQKDYIITEVNDELIIGQPLSKVQDLLSGPLGAEVVLAFSKLEKKKSSKQRFSAVVLFDYKPKSVDKAEYALNNYSSWGEPGLLCAVDALGLKVTGFITGSSAALSGLQIGDVIIEVDDELLIGLPSALAFDKMTGDRGTEVALTAIRQDPTKGAKGRIAAYIVRDVGSVRKVAKSECESSLNLAYDEKKPTPEFAHPGISIKTTSKGLRVTSVKKGSSAAEELRSNDLITAINDDIIVGLSLEAAITKLEGGGGSTVELTGWRTSKGGKQRIQCSVQRDVACARKEGVPGVTVKLVAGGLSISKVHEGTSAKNEGIAAGDLIVMIDDDFVCGTPWEQAMHLLSGQSGTNVRLTVMRVEGQTKRRELFETVRDFNLKPLDSAREARRKAVRAAAGIRGVSTMKDKEPRQEVNLLCRLRRLFASNKEMTKRSSLAKHAFAAALSAIPDEDWFRNWPAERTIMLRMTSKRIQEAVDNLRPPAIFRLIPVLCKDERLQGAMEHLADVPARCRITTLDISRCGVKGENVDRLAAILVQCPALAHLDLGSNDIGDEGAGILAGVLVQCLSLAHLNLSNNAIGPDGAGRLSGVLAMCPALSELYLNDNKIGAEGAGVLAGVLAQSPALSVLSLHGNQIGAEGLGRLAGVLPLCPALSKLALGGNNIGDQGLGRLAGVLPHCPALSELYLNDNQIRAEGVGRLAGVLPLCPALSTLDLGDNDIGDQGAGRLAGVLPQCFLLSHLYLHNDRIGAEGAGRLAGGLAQCTTVRSLNLMGNKIRAEGAKMLSDVLVHCPALAHLDLGSNDIGDEGAESLAGVLVQCLSLTHLNLSNNGIRNDGAGRLAGELGQCHALSHVHLNCNEIGDQGAGMLARVLAQCPGLVHLDLKWNHIGDQGAGQLAGVLPQCKPLSTLNLAGNLIRLEGAGKLRQCWQGNPAGLVLI